MASDEEDWPDMTGEELSQILAMEDHADSLQEALESARAHVSDDWQKTAAELLERLDCDPDHPLEDATTDKKKTVTRLEVLADELMRAHFESVEIQ